jgi:predicted metalloprotease with PDZ domain
MRPFPQSLEKSVSAIAILALIVFFGSQVASARIQDKSADKPWLGVSIRDVSSRIADENKLEGKSGAYVTSVLEESPADSAGIEEGDIIVTFAKKKIDNADDLVKAVAESKVGQKVEIVLVRNSAKKTFGVVLSKYIRPRARHFSVGPFGNRMWMFANRSAQGMELLELNNQLGEYFGVPDGTGILVEKVTKKGPAEKAGIKAGDVLVKIGNRTIDDLEDVSKAFSRYDEGEKVEVQVLRKGISKTFSLVVEGDQESPMFRFFHRGGERGDLYWTPRFEGDFFGNPGWNDQEFKMRFHDLEPKMNELKEKIEGMTRNLKGHEHDIMKVVRESRIRTI